MKRVYVYTYFISIFLVSTQKLHSQNDSLLYRYKNKFVADLAFNYIWDNSFGHPYYEIKINPNIYYFPWARTGFGLGVMDIITNDITNKSHLRNFYFSHILVQQRFLRPHMYIESGISVGNYYLGDSSTVHTPLKFALPFGFGFSFYISKKVFIDLSFITYYQRGVLPNDFYRVGLGYNFNTIHIEN